MAEKRRRNAPSAPMKKLHWKTSGALQNKSMRSRGLLEIRGTYAARAIAKPSDVRIPNGGACTAEALNTDWLRHAGSPLFNFRMTVRKGKPACVIVVRGGQIHPTGAIRIEEPGVVDAVGVFIDINPCFGRSRINHIAHLTHLLVNWIPRTIARATIPSANPDIT